MKNLKKIISNNLLNIPGWYTNRKIVVIESDDWGSIRMPSREVYNQFLKEGIRVDKDPYCRYDSLATKDDLQMLFDVLCSVKDKNGRNAVLTADTVVANPDFKKIREADFQAYYYEDITTTMANSPNHTKVFDVWKEGMKANIFYPQFHGREHLNIKKWLTVLLENKDKITRRAFELGTFGLNSNVSSEIQGGYMGAFDSSLEEDIEKYEVIIKEGLAMFKQIFGYDSESFIATTYTWSPLIEPILKDNGVNYLQGMVAQRIPLDGGKSFKYRKTNFQGCKNKCNQIYLMRNCFFEPTQYRQKIDVVDDCLYRIGNAFRWKKAAVISSHRLNYIGNIDITNREKNLVLLKELLSSILKKWPDVEFCTSDELGKIIGGK